MKKIILVVILFFSISLNAQTKRFEELEKYSRLGILIGGDLYNKAKIEREYGELTFKNLPIPSYSFGFEYDLFPQNRWSVITGLNFSRDPLSNFEYSFEAKDIPDLWPNGLKDQASGYSYITSSIPVILSFKARISNKVFLELRAGLKAKYYKNGFAEQTVSFIDDTITRTVFGLRMENTNINNWYGSFVFGAGMNFLTKWSLIKVNLEYNYNFQNPIEGEYLFDNLLVSKRTYGKYYLSGNYLGLNVLFHLNRDIFKRKLKKSYTVNLPF